MTKNSEDALMPTETTKPVLSICPNCGLETVQGYVQCWRCGKNILIIIPRGNPK